MPFKKHFLHADLVPCLMITVPEWVWVAIELQGCHFWDPTGMPVRMQGCIRYVCMCVHASLFSPFRSSFLFDVYDATVGVVANTATGMSFLGPRSIRVQG